MFEKELPNQGEMVIYTSSDGIVQTEVQLFEETLWLTEQQIGSIFRRDRSVISKHIKSIFQTGELDDKSNVQKMHIANSDKPVSFYGLDVILSVGYRVNSKQGTQFRIWANRILKEHLIKGFTINEKRLAEQHNQIRELKESILLVERSLLEEIETPDKARSMVKVLADFAQGLEILDDYDHETLQNEGISSKQAVYISAEEFREIIILMQKDYDTSVFARQKDFGFESSVNQIYQSFGGQELYPGIELKAAVLLYLIVKNHSFVDGNKRIAAGLFLHFLEKNDILYKTNGKQIISNDGLAALTLLIAVSKPEEKETMIKITMTILNRNQA